MTWPLVREIVAVTRLVTLTSKDLQATGATSLALSTRRIIELYNTILLIKHGGAVWVPEADSSVSTSSRTSSSTTATFDFLDGPGFICVERPLQLHAAKAFVSVLETELRVRLFMRNGETIPKAQERISTVSILHDVHDAHSKSAHNPSRSDERALFTLSALALNPLTAFLPAFVVKPTMSDKERELEGELVVRNRDLAVLELLERVGAQEAKLKEKRRAEREAFDVDELNDSDVEIDSGVSPHSEPVTPDIPDYMRAMFGVSALEHKVADKLADDTDMEGLKQLLNQIAVFRMSMGGANALDLPGEFKKASEHLLAEARVRLESLEGPKFQVRALEVEDEVFRWFWEESEEFAKKNSGVPLFRRLRRLAYTLAALQPSGAKAESIFSVAGKAMNKYQIMMEPYTLHMKVFIKTNPLYVPHSADVEWLPYKNARESRALDSAASEAEQAVVEAEIEAFKRDIMLSSEENDSFAFTNMEDAEYGERRAERAEIVEEARRGLEELEELDEDDGGSERAKEAPRNDAEEEGFEQFTQTGGGLLRRGNRRRKRKQYTGFEVGNA